MSKQVGDLVRLRANFTRPAPDPNDPPVEVDPTAVVVRIKDPEGTVTTPDASNDPNAVGAFYYDLALTMPGEYTWRFEGTGAAVAADEATIVVESSAFTAGAGPLAPFSALVARLGYAPVDDGPSLEAARGMGLLVSASALIRDESGLDFAEGVPQRVRDICVEVAHRAFVNGEGLSQHSLGDENKSFDRAGVGGGSALYLTPQELKAVRRAGGGSSFRAVTLVSPYSGEAVADVIAQ